MVNIDYFLLTLSKPFNRFFNNMMSGKNFCASGLGKVIKEETYKEWVKKILDAVKIGLPILLASNNNSILVAH